MKFLFVIFISISQITLVNCSKVLSEPIFIRANQVGFLPNDLKTAVILSTYDLSGMEFSVLDSNSGEVKYKDTISSGNQQYGSFNFGYEIDFSPLTRNGIYKISLNDSHSHPFEIGENVYNNVRDSLSLFFKVQRCGPTNPILHQPCHLSDVSRITGLDDSSSRDLTGGWHDAGDYIKFLKTTAYTTYLLLFSYEFDQVKFNYDLDKNDVPDILEEARIGIDWLLQCNIEEKILVSQVQNEDDHSVGWRLPENDSLQFDRAGYVSIGKNTLGIYSAVLALASRIWKNRFYEYDFADRCLKISKKFYDIRNSVQDIDSTYSNHYPDVDFNGKLALAAIELYYSTLSNSYLKEAIEYSHKAGADYWWSVGAINSLAHFKVAKFDSTVIKYIKSNLDHSTKMFSNSLFREGLDYSWGTTNSLLGMSLQSILFKTLTSSSEFDSLGIFQRDYILGRNPWGISFIYNIGTRFSKNLHSQVGFFNHGYLPGALSAGPAPKALFQYYEIKRSNTENERFNNEVAAYYDDVNDYITNEPTISANATALFVFGYFALN